jgi:DNA polymerase IV
MPRVRTWPRIVVHADMDAFYAAVEQLDDPKLRGRPILVGGRSGRGVVLTASYEARPFGVHSAMPMARARRLCPQALIVPPRFERYQEISERLMEAFADFSPRVEALSLDEAFLDMTGAEEFFGPPEKMGKRIKEAVRDATSLIVSVGLSGTKYVAKVASDYGKPDGLTVVPQDRAQAWLAPMPVSRLWGAGPKLQARLVKIGLPTIGDIAATDERVLVARLGQIGERLHALAHARDPRPVARNRAAKSVGCDRTLEVDISRRDAICQHLHRAADTLGRRLRRKGYVARGVRVKLKTTDFRLLTRQRTLAEPTDVAATLYRNVVPLLESMLPEAPFRLVGLAAYDLTRIVARQSDLFDTDAPRRRLEAAIDALAERFGPDVVHRAADLAQPRAPRLAPTLDFLDDEDDDAP